MKARTCLLSMVASRESASLALRLIGGIALAAIFIGSLAITGFAVTEKKSGP
jgi:hypothetical protein